MKSADCAKKLQEKFPLFSLEWIEPVAGDSFLFVPAQNLREVISFLKEDWELAFDYLMNLSGVDVTECIEVVYHLHSYRNKHSFIIKVKAPRSNGQVPSLSAIYGTAIFQEREVFDMLGTQFSGHPDLRRLLLPENWVGHPLLKDYQEPAEYQGIDTKRESLV